MVDSRSISVLNVNDEAGARYAITRMLRRAGFTVSEATTGAECLQRVSDNPDVVVLDVKLPDMHGFEVCKRIKSSPATRSIGVLLTSSTFVSTEKRVQGLEGGADAYLVQPAEAVELVAMVRALVRARRAEDERHELLARERAARAEAEAARAEAEAHRAESELQRAHLHSILMNLPASIAITRGPEHVFELVNDVYQRIAGPQRHLLGRRIREAIPECERQGPLDVLDQVYRTGEPFVDTELRAPMDSSGTGELEEVFVNVVIQPLRSARGEIEGLITLAVDITEQVRTRADAEESERNYRFLADSIPAIVYTAAADGRIDYVNKMWTHYTGLDEGKAPDFRSEVLHPDDVPPCKAAWGRAIESGEPLEIMCRMRRADGQYRWHISRAIPLRGATGKVTKWFGTTFDIDDQRRAEAALRDSEERLHLALWAANVGTWRVDLETKLDTRDANVNRILGLTAIESTTPIDDFVHRVHPDDLSRLLERVEQAVVSRRLYDEECRIVRPDGSVRWLRNRGQVICGPDGEPRYLTGAAADVTAEKEAQRERDQLLTRERAAREGAERLNRLKDEFLATISHELRTPLTAILGWARMIRAQRLGPDQIAKGIEIIERNARAQAQLIEDILDVSAIITGKVRINPRSTSVKSFIEAALETVRPAAEARGVTLTAEIDEGVGVMVGDEDRLQQVVWNLLSNGVKFTPTGGHVRVRAERISSEITITVSDTGKGIAADFLPFVFDRFRQEDSSTTRHQGGLGLGLAIVRHLVEMHGGSVEAHSEGEGKGASITIHLPIRAAEPAQVLRARPDPSSQQKAVAAQPEDLRGVQVLVVDDEADARDLLHAILGHAGASVTLAESVRGAMIALNEYVPDVLVSDIGMPGEDGYVLMQKVRALGHHNPVSGVPAIALTAYARSEDRRRALASGFQMHVSKPIEPCRLVAAIAQLAGRGGCPQRRSAV
jgi:PAS domain S-box-containing protein